MSHTRLLRTGWHTEHHDFQLSKLTHVWLEGMVGSYVHNRVSLGFTGKWMPLSLGYQERYITQKLESQLCDWLDRKGYSVETGEGWLPGQSWKTYVSDMAEK